MNDWTTTTNKIFELYTDTYYSLVNSLLWGQERMLQLNKTVVAQFEASQTEGKKFVDEYAERARRAQSIFQEAVEETVKATTTNLNTMRVASDASVVELNQKVEAISEKLATNGKKAAV
jgi:polyhydroxyalkanoate synthesis regulator phasin